MLVRSIVVALPLLYFIARSPVVGVYALTFLIPLEVFARIPNEFFSVYKLLGILTLTSAAVHLLSGSVRPVSRGTALHRWMFAFLFFIASSLLWSIEPELTLRAVRRLVSLMIFYFLVVRLVDTKEKLRVLFGVMIAAAVVAAAFAIIAYMRADAVFDTQSEVTVDGKLRASGMSLDANFFAAIILTALPMCVLLLPVERSGVRFVLLVSSVLIVLGTIYSFSRGAALTLGLMAAFMFAIRLSMARGRARSATLITGLLAVVVVFIVMPSSYRERVQSLGSPMQGDESIRGRWLYVEFSQESVQRNPMGVGAGAFPIAFRDSRFNQEYRYYNLDPGQEQGRSAHNMYLEVLVEGGVLGGLLFIAMVVFAQVECVRVARFLARKKKPFERAACWSIAVALVAFCFSGLFLSAQYEKQLWLLLALVAVGKNLAYEGEEVLPDFGSLHSRIARRRLRSA